MRRPPVFAGNQVAGGHLPVAEFPGGHALTDRRHSCRRAWAAGTPPVLAHRQPGEKPTCQRVHFSNGSRLREDLSERRSFRSAPVFIGSVLNLRENSAIFFALGSNKSRAGFFPQIQGSADRPDLPTMLPRASPHVLNRRPIGSPCSEIWPQFGRSFGSTNRCPPGPTSSSRSSSRSPSRSAAAPRF